MIADEWIYGCIKLHCNSSQRICIFYGGCTWVLLNKPLISQKGQRTRCKWNFSKRHKTIYSSTVCMYPLFFFVSAKMHHNLYIYRVRSNLSNLIGDFINWNVYIFLSYMQFYCLLQMSLSQYMLSRYVFV